VSSNDATKYRRIKALLESSLDEEQFDINDPERAVAQLVKMLEQIDQIGAGLYHGERTTIDVLFRAVAELKALRELPSAIEAVKEFSIDLLREGATIIPRRDE